MMGKAAFVLALALAGCGGLGQGSYELGSGDANYDALKTATLACQAQGGAIRRRNGYDGRDLSGYECAGGKAR